MNFLSHDHFIIPTDLSRIFYHTLILHFIIPTDLSRIFYHTLTLLYPQTYQEFSITPSLYYTHRLSKIFYHALTLLYPQT